MLAWENTTDLTISLGTSMSGMNSDRVFTTVATKAVRNPSGADLGGVIIGLQCTQYDHLSCLRIFAPIDGVMQLLLTKLALPSPECKPALLCVPETCKRGPHKFMVPYDPVTGIYRPDLKDHLTELNLEEGAIVRITAGPYAGDTGEVMYVTDQGMYNIQFSHEINSTTHLRRPLMRALGWWWIQEAVEGTIGSIPVVNVLSSLSSECRR